MTSGWLMRRAVTWSLLAVAVSVLVLLARRDRGSRPHQRLVIDRRTIRLADAAVPPAARTGLADMRQAAAELDRAAAEADAARAGLEATNAELDRTRQALERQRQELEGLRADADASVTAKHRELEAAREELGARRTELERASREAEERVVRARRELAELERARVASAAAFGVARGLGRGPRTDMRAAPDPRRMRSPALAPFVPNQAAVVAAGAAGRPGVVAAGPPPNQPAVGTLRGDVLRGEADVVEARGRYVVDSSTAAINAETARAMALDNRVRTAETFFEARRINHVNRAFEAGPAITADQAARLAAIGMPTRPSMLELDPATGTISWPRVLQDPAYEALTTRIQRHFHDRVSRGGSCDPGGDRDCAMAFDELEDCLRADVGRHPAGHYGRARTFLDGLRLEYGRSLDD